MSFPDTPNDNSHIHRGWPSTAIFIILLTVPVVGTILFGAVDRQTVGLLGLLVASAVLLWLYDAFTRGRLFVPKNPLPIALVALILIGIVQLLPVAGEPTGSGVLSVEPSQSLSLDPFATRVFVAKLSIFLLFFATFLAYGTSRRRIKTSLITLITFGTLVGAFAILQRLAQADAIYGLRETPQAIPFGPFVNQHHFASLMVMLIAPALALLLSGVFKRDRQPVLWLAVAVMTIAVVATGSRGGILSLSAAVGLVLLGGRSGERRTEANGSAKKTRTSLYAIIAAGAILIIGIVIFLGFGEGLLRGLGATSATDDISSGRLHYWQTAVKMIGDAPFIGVGFDAFGVAYPLYDTRSGLFRLEHAHNEYLQVLAEGGVAALTVVIAFIALLIRGGISVIRRTAHPFGRAAALGSLAACIGVLVHSFFDFPLRTNSNAFVFLILVAIATTRQIASPNGNEQVLSSARG